MSWNSSRNTSNFSAMVTIDPALRRSLPDKHRRRQKVAALVVFPKQTVDYRRETADMTTKFWRQVAMCALVLGAGTVMTTAQTQDEVPADLRPLLSAPLSEMRLVTQRYSMDRNTLNGNYLSGGGRQGGGGRGARGG